jgi:enamine deaminase RidA (YjgF/YER057c/UK114 family)
MTNPPQGDLPVPVVVPDWSRPHGYSDGVTARGRILVTAGMIGWNPQTQAIESDNFASQTAQALRNIVAVLQAASAEPRHLIRMTWYVTSRDEYLAAREGVGLAYREIIGKHYPTMAVVVVAGLLDPRAKVEIEATAMLPYIEPG